MRSGLSDTDGRYKRQLDLVYRIDHLRDNAVDAKHMLRQVADITTKALEADLCLISYAQEDDASVLKALSDRKNVLSALTPQQAQSLLDSACRLDALASIGVPEPLGEEGVQQIIAVPLFAGGARLGAFVLGNSGPDLDAEEMQLVHAIASQTDSAIAHLRTVEQAREHARQLEAIFKIDHLRDEADSVSDIYPSVVNVIAQTLRADLCLLSLVNGETGEIELREVQDRAGVFADLDRQVVAQVLEWALSLDGTGVPASDFTTLDWKLYVAGAPLVVGGERLGALVVAKRFQPWDRSELELLQAIASQTDSAIVHARAEIRLRQRTKELETLYRVDHIRDQGYGFGEMLSAVLSELCSAIEAEMGFIMLFDPEGKQLELRASTADDMLASAGHYPLIAQAANESLRRGGLYAQEGLSDWLRAIVCLPLILRERIIGVFGAVNRRGHSRFTQDDKRLLLAITSQVDTAIFESLDRQRVRATFQRYVGPRVMEQMLATSERDFLKGERALLTVLFSDMRGFTSMSEKVDVDTLVEMINSHLGAMTRIVLAHQGTLDKFVADEVVAIFGAPLTMRYHTLAAIRAALDMQAEQRRLIAEWQERGYRLPPIGIGINVGEMVVGNIGCEQQMDYTVIGDAVNLASRLCDAAAGEQILVTEAVFHRVRDHVVASELPRIRVKGKDDPVQIYHILGLRDVPSLEQEARA